MSKLETKLNEYLAIHGESKAYYTLWRDIAEKNPDLHKRWVKELRYCRPKSKVSPRIFLETVVRGGWCSECGKFRTHPKCHKVCEKCARTEVGAALRKERIYEARDARFFEKHGVKSPSQLDSVKQKIADTVELRYGVRNPAQVPSLYQKARESCLRNNGYVLGSHPRTSEMLAKQSSSMKKWWTPENKKARRSLHKERYGVDHPMQLKEIADKAKATKIDRYGDNFSKVIDAKRQKTNLERYGQNTPFKVAACREKSGDTLEARLGVRHQMQHQETLQRTLEKARSIRDVKVGRKVYRVQGSSEAAMVPFLLTKTRKVLTQFHKKYPKSAFADLGMFPDFYLPEHEVFVECKSWWTFMGRGFEHLSGCEGDLEFNRAKAKKAGETCRWIIHAKKNFVVLPADWFNWSPKKIRTFVQPFIRG